MAPASPVWFDAGVDTCVGCGFPTAAHRNQFDRWVGCDGAERVFELRHRLAQQLAASLYKTHQQVQRQGVRHAGSLRVCGAVRKP